MNCWLLYGTLGLVKNAVTRISKTVNFTVCNGFHDQTHILAQRNHNKHKEILPMATWKLCCALCESSVNAMHYNYYWYLLIILSLSHVCLFDLLSISILWISLPFYSDCILYLFCKCHLTLFEIIHAQAFLI